MTTPALAELIDRFDAQQRRYSRGMGDACRRVSDLARETFPLTYSPAGGPVTYGGQPELPQGMAWPHRQVLTGEQRWETYPDMADGHPLSFLASYDLDAIAAQHGQHPHARLHGQLLVFIDARDRGLSYGFDSQRFPMASHPMAAQRDDYQVVHVTPGTSTAPAQAPEGATVWPQSSLATAPTWTFPGHDAIELEGRAADDDPDHLSNFNQYALAQGRPDGHPEGHQFLGWATRPAQRDPRFACPSAKDRWYDRIAVVRREHEIYHQHDRDMDAAQPKIRALYENHFGWETGSRDPWATDDERGWALLASIGDWDHKGGGADEDEDAQAWTWGDGGTVYLLIRADDLAAGRYDRVVLTYQGS